MHRVSQVEVLREWLRVERSHPDVEWFPIDSLSERAALDELLDRKPGAAAFVWRDAPVTWYETTLDRADFAELRVVEGPTDLRWRDLSPDGTIRGAADRVASEDPEKLSAETGVDVETVLEFVDEMPDGPLVVSTREGCVPRYVADGNHRAVALALRIRSGEFSPQRAYLGVGANPVAKPLLERLCGGFRCLFEE
ncbi:hypothetical protein M0R88_10070 [Halorussus gelatinilyticus]|uniref:Uncharacterized protein n=1 Tax=Halorussus gelatinilyticus TaxID=2937524 RepID=A0A8U0IFQ0_9EURY|nr:hypothetical protein [Halorussus gelatinilyticus]UPV98878.1 hypothetical protein M0R88_10070 [Halorussus gelatinilyticus]